MGLIAELHLHGNIILFEETFDRAPGAECTFEGVHYVTDDNERTHYVFFWWMAGTERTTFERALMADPTVDEYRMVTALEEKHLYRVQTTSFPPDQSLVFPVFREQNVTAIDSKRNADGLYLKARFPDRDALETFVESGSEIATHVDVTGLYTEQQTAVEEQLLTEKQYAALSVALERGYFDSPSRVSLSELAAESDVTPQTLSTHIRAGVKKLVESAVDINETVGDQGL